MRAGMFGWSLPPGVTQGMIDRAYGYDDEERPLIHCSRCGGFLKQEPDRIGGGEDWGICDGRTQAHYATYDAEADAGILDIIGDHFAGRRYTVEMPPVCETKTEDHPAHTYTRWAWGINYRTCRRCGYENEEVDA